MSISAVLDVYNEEARIEATLRCAMWCDEIVVMDKQSTDRTQEIARRYTDRVYEIPYSDFDPNELQRIVDHASCEWIIWLTPSDVLHPDLANRIRDLTEREDFDYDVIHVPYRRYVLGLETRRSPWYSELHPAVFRKRVVKIRHDTVHSAIDFETSRHFKMPKSTDECLYHLTHRTMDSMMEGHTRYLRGEAQTFPQEMTLRKAFKPILRAAFDVVIRRKTWLMGWDGVALAMAFLSYWLLRFAYIWERRRSHAPQIYQNIRESVLQAWEQSEATKHV